MKLTKTQLIIVVAIAAVAVWYLFLRKKDDSKKESSFVKKTSGTVGIGESSATNNYTNCEQNCSTTLNQAYSQCGQLTSDDAIAACRNNAKTQYFACKNQCYNTYLAQTGTA